MENGHLYKYMIYPLNIMIFNSYVKLPEGTWTIKQSTALGIKQLKHMERLATSRCFWTQLVASAKFLPNWNCVLIANMIFVNWNGQSELKPPKYIYHITYISLAIMPIAFHRKQIQKKVSKQWIPPETHPQGFALARWKCGCDAFCFGAPVGPLTR